MNFRVGGINSFFCGMCSLRVTTEVLIRTVVLVRTSVATARPLWAYMYSMSFIE